MFKGILDFLRFLLERLILKGPAYRLALVAFMIVAISVCAGTFVILADAGPFNSYGHAIWWAFLRLSDPGYLGDDKGVLLTIVSTLITVAGYVVFLGALVAIMTQWFNQTMNRLQAGLTPISQKGHIVILGWNNRVPTIVRELFNSEGRVQRFLKRHGARKLRIALLSQEDPSKIVQDLNDKLGKNWDPARLIVRTGNHLKAEHLERIDFINASVILLPAESIYLTNSTVDANSIKTLITIGNASRSSSLLPPLLVAEIIDDRKTTLAAASYGGPIEIVSSGVFLSKLIAQTLRNQGLSHIYSELLGHEWGNEVYIREVDALIGQPFSAAFEVFQRSIPIGIIQKKDNRLISVLCPPMDEMIYETDRFVVVSEDFESSEPVDIILSSGKKQIDKISIDLVEKKRRKILILGWNYKVPFIISEFTRYEKECSELTIVSRTPLEEREALFSRQETNLGVIKLEHLTGDFTSPSDLEEVSLEAFDSILLLASDSIESDYSTDARTILGFLVLQEKLRESKENPHILVELLDADNAPLINSKGCEILVSPVVVSHILTQVGLRHELNLVFDELFGAEGAEIKFVRAKSIFNRGASIRFEEIQENCIANGRICIGVRHQSNKSLQTTLNPPKECEFSVDDYLQLILIIS